MERIKVKRDINVFVHNGGFVVPKGTELEIKCSTTSFNVSAYVVEYENELITLRRTDVEVL